MINYSLRTKFVMIELSQSERALQKALQARQVSAVLSESFVVPSERTHSRVRIQLPGVYPQVYCASRRQNFLSRILSPCIHTEEDESTAGVLLRTYIRRGIKMTYPLQGREQAV